MLLVRARRVAELRSVTCHMGSHSVGSQDGAFKRWIRQLHPNDVVAKSVDTLPPLFRHWVFGCGSAEACGSGRQATTTTTATSQCYLLPNTGEPTPLLGCIYTDTSPHFRTRI